MQNRSRADVARILAEDIERALNRYRALRPEATTSRRAKASQAQGRERQFHRSCGGTRESAAILALSESLLRHSEFVLDGRIPEDLHG